jgi:ssDNA-binding Zn-finger/Zn-ribbon topoisomerase 1
MSDQARKKRHSMHIRDARGRKVTQLDPVMMHLLRRHDVIEAEALHAIAEDIGPGFTRASRIATWVFFTLGAGGVAAMLIRAYLFRSGLDAMGKILTVINVVSLVLVVFGLWIGARKMRFGRVKRIMLAHRRCPHCGYDLKRLPADARDGATVCPECGCAWKVNEEGLRDQGTRGLQGSPDSGG